MTAVVVAIFTPSYALIATRRPSLLPIGRPAGALLGAVLMVAVGALTPEASFAAVDADTIVLLSALMILSAYLERAGIFRRLSRANIGSAATLVGNPQNMIIGSASGYAFSEFSRCAGPASVVGLSLNAIPLRLYYARRMPPSFQRDLPEAPVGGDEWPRLAPFITCCVTLGYFAGFHLGYTTLAGVMVLMIFDRREPTVAFGRVDWTLLVFFSALFVVVAGVAKTGLVELAWSHASGVLDFESASGLGSFTAAMLLGSNVFSNVPMVLLTGPHLAELGDPALGWVLLAFTTTIAGNLTLVGSVANLIVAEQAKEHYELGFFEYLRLGLVSTVVVLAAGVPLIVWTMS